MIEIVVVIVILVALASIATPLYLNHVKKANIATAKTQIKLLEQALTDYKLDTGKFPETDDGLQVLVENTKIFRKEGKVYSTQEDGTDLEVTGNEYVSMNSWGFMPEMVGEIEALFLEFLKGF